MTQQDRDQLFVMFVEIVDFPKLESLLPQHLAWLTGKFEDGNLVVTGRLTEGTGAAGDHALVIVRAPSLEAAEKTVSQDPLHVGGACRFTFRGFTPRMHTKDFGTIIPDTDSTPITPLQHRSPQSTI